MMKMSEKIFLQLQAPTEEDFRSSSRRITDALQPDYGQVRVPVQSLRKLYPLCQKAAWKITVTLARDAQGWVLVNVEAGEEINFREVIMHKGDQPLIYAISHVPLGRCSKEVCADLLRADIPIGRILKNYKIESRREVGNIFIEKPNDTVKELFKTDEDFLARDYVIINNDEILMWIKEMFPVSYFTEI